MLFLYRSRVPSAAAGSNWRQDLLALPFRLMPEKAQAVVLAAVLDRLIAHAGLREEFDFLEGRTVAIGCPEIGREWRLTLRGGHIVAVHHGAADVRMRGSITAFLELAAAHEDADALFFRRELVLEGDVELGLRLRNLLDAHLAALIPPPLRRVLDAMARFAADG